MLFYIGKPTGSDYNTVILTAITPLTEKIWILEPL